MNALVSLYWNACRFLMFACYMGAVITANCGVEWFMKPHQPAEKQVGAFYMPKSGDDVVSPAEAVAVQNVFARAAVYEVGQP